MADTFYWHDYETWGADPARDRPAQFAGQRTDADLNPIGEPLVLYCRPADDLLPQPDACLVTGITPQLALDRGVTEADFIDRIHAELIRPGTCTVGYNNIRFDDEVTRYTLFRNFFDPYAREWRNGNSRWDLIDVMRLAHALRPGGIHWPRREDGTTSFRLEQLSAANGLLHAAAHDALSDVQATVALARLLRQRQPRLFEFALSLRAKRQAEALLNPEHPRPLLHVSSKYPAATGCIAPVVALARHPVNRNGILVADLRQDPHDLLTLDPETIRERLFTPVEELPEGTQRPALKTVHINRSPMLAPMNTLTPEAAERWAIDPARARTHADALLQAPGLADKLRSVFAAPERPQRRDPEQDLYGAFIGDEDRPLCQAVRATPPEELGRRDFPFLDKRLPTLLFRFRARNWPETLAPTERDLWNLYRRKRLNDPDGGGSITRSGYRERIRVLRAEQGDDAAALSILEALESWDDTLAD